MAITNSREKSGQCMKKKTLRRGVNFKPPKEQTESTRPHRYAEPGFYRLCSERDHHDQIPAGHPDIEKVQTTASARPMSRARLIAGISTRGKFPMEGRQNLSSAGGTGSILRRADQVFCLKTYSTAANPSGTARMTRKTGARTAVIGGTTRIPGSGPETRWSR